MTQTTNNGYTPLENFDKTADYDEVRDKVQGLTWENGGDVFYFDHKDDGQEDYLEAVLPDAYVRVERTDEGTQVSYKEKQELSGRTAWSDLKGDLTSESTESQEEENELTAPAMD